MAARRKWLIPVIAIPLIAFIVHQPLLIWITSEYLCHDRVDESRITHVYMVNGDRMLETAAAIAAQGKTILLTQPVPPRSVQCGAAPAEDDLLPKLLAEQGIDDSQMLMLTGQARDGRERLLKLGNWLEEHPEASVCMLVEALAGGGMRRVVDNTLSAGAASRVKIKSLEPTEFSSRRWWRSTAGCKAFYGQTVSRIYRLATRKAQPPADYQSPQEYEDSFKRRLQSLGCGTAVPAGGPE